MWVAVGTDSSNAFRYSYDGINWSESTNGSSIASLGYGVAWNGSLWVAAAFGGVGTPGTRIAYSTDGIVWSAGTTSSSAPFSATSVCYAVAWNGSRWIATGSKNNSNSDTIAYSTDGINWTGASTGTAIIQNRGYAVASRTAGTGVRSIVAGDTTSAGNEEFAYSTDGITWFGWGTGANSPTSLQNSKGTAVGWNGSRWVLAGDTSGGNCLIYSNSSQALLWSASANGNTIFTTRVNGLAWNGTRWVAGGSGTNALGYSSDGITWSGSTNGNTIFSNVYGIASKPGPQLVPAR
jgi:hypothetical protein